MDVTGEPAKGAERGQLVVGRDQSLDGAVDEIRQVRAAADNPFHCRSGERIRGIVPGLDTEKCADFCPMTDTRADGVTLERQARETRAVGSGR